jgi:hypothetical protein
MKEDGQIALAGVESVGKDIADDIKSGKPPKPLDDLVKKIKI